MIYVLYAFHIVLCLFLILVVLLQQGKGADLSVFGGGTTMTAFGARSATTLLHRMTVVAFVGFVLTTILIAYLQGQTQSGSVMKGARKAATPAPVSAPAATPATAPAAAPTTTEPAPATPSGTPSEAPAPPPSN